MKILLLNQCFYPDVMATAQQLASLATGLREKGHDVTVITSDRGYDDPSRRFARRETWKGIEIVRIPSLALGKETKWRRTLNFLSFIVACSWRLLLLPRFDCVVALTSPPLISLLAAVFVQLKGGKFFFWVMDLNPDEAVAAGWLKPDSLSARILGSFLHHSLRHAERVIVLDRFMKARIESKGVPARCIEVLSPWALDGSDDGEGENHTIRFDEKRREDFRARHHLSEKFVVMYSGNHSPCHPLDTLLQASLLLARRSDIDFCFVGGGSEQAKVAVFAARNNLQNVHCFPYQAIEDLPGSLSAADLHVVVMGDPFVGIVHPCKIYNILAVGAPLLYIGPKESSVADIATLVQKQYAVYEAQHGETERVAEHILAAAALKSAGNSRSSAECATLFSKAKLLPRMIEILEAGKEQWAVGGQMKSFESRV